MGKILNIELSESTYEKVVNEAKSLDRSVRKMVSLLVERGLESKPEPQLPTPVYQPQPQPAQSIHDRHLEPMARPQWQIDEIDRLKKEKLVRAKELRKAEEDEIDEYTSQDDWVDDGVTDIVDKYNQLVEDMEKEIDEKLNAIYEKSA